MSCHVAVQIEDEKWLEDAENIEHYVKEVTAAVIKQLALEEELEISVLCTNDMAMQKLNQEFRHKDKPTNVLSFPQHDITPGQSLKKLLRLDSLMLGDIVLSYETIKKEAEQQEKTFKQHLAHLITHATLHLLGYDHQEEIEAEAMEGLEIKVLKNLGIDNPYEI